ncbi:intracellular growth attenuator family protein [Morganella morganii]|nr:intracellular growth attenuator family protein [Morganella morganii]
MLPGIPKRWGLFGDFDHSQKHSISLGGIDLIYPRHWEPWLHQDLGSVTQIEMYEDQQVVRQGNTSPCARNPPASRIAVTAKIC